MSSYQEMFSWLSLRLKKITTNYEADLREVIANLEVIQEELEGTKELSSGEEYHQGYIDGLQFALKTFENGD